MSWLSSHSSHFLDIQSFLGFPKLFSGQLFGSRADFPKLFSGLVLGAA